MDSMQVERIRKSWREVEANGVELARSFYARLFELDPTIRDLFAIVELDSQGEKFMAMMGEIVRLVEDPDRFEAILEESGRRHAGYGVSPRDYMTVGEAFLWAVDHAIPGGFDPETRSAWAEAYTRMAHLMKRGAGHNPAQMGG